MRPHLWYSTPHFAKSTTEHQSCPGQHNLHLLIPYKYMFLINEKQTKNNLVMDGM